MLCGCVRFLCDPMDSSFHGDSLAKILECVGMHSSRGSSHTKDRTKYPTLQEDSLPSEPRGKPLYKDTTKQKADI